MRIAVLGTGMVGRSLAGRLAELGHTVVMGTRDPEATRGRSDHSEIPGVELVTFADAAGSAGLVVNATSGTVSLEVLEQAGKDNLAGKVLVDVANPLDFSRGFPPTLAVEDTDSLGEQIQRTYPQSHVVKTLNTMNASVMVHPETVGEGDHTVFVAWDDGEAKATVVGVLRDIGHTDVMDLGDIAAARGVEMFLPLWLRLMGRLGTPAFGVKVAR